LLLVGYDQAEVPSRKLLIRGRTNATRAGIEPKSCDHGHQKKKILSTTLPTNGDPFATLRLSHGLVIEPYGPSALKVSGPYFTVQAVFELAI